MPAVIKDDDAEELQRSIDMGRAIEAHVRATRGEDVSHQEYIIEVSDGGGHAITLRTRYSALEQLRTSLAAKAPSPLDCNGSLASPLYPLCQFDDIPEMPAKAFLLAKSLGGTASEHEMCRAFDKAVTTHCFNITDHRTGGSFWRRLFTIRTMKMYVR